ncbi:MAG: tRNA (adenosine(37)-N6)-threonylcarbamoyltransferase complex dimerization subunit type 1 TsaB [Gemmatimonadota bacterium]
MMDLTLGIETSTLVGSIAVGVADDVLAEVVLGTGTRHSEQLLPAIEYALGIADGQCHQIHRVVIGSGPGSFTGLRIAAATAKGLAATLEIEVFGYSGLLALAAGSGIRDRPVCALFDARRAEVYAACYDLDGTIDVVMKPRVAPIESVLSELAAANPVYIGEGARKHEAMIQQRGYAVLPAHVGIPRASALLWLAHTHTEYGRIADLHHWEPDYLRASGAERGVRG